MSEPAPKLSDPDAPLVAGCFAFAGFSVAGFLLSLWPFFVYGETWRAAVVGQNLLLGLLPALGLGIVATRRFGIPGAGSLIAMSLTFGLFFFLRHWPMTFAAGRLDVPQLDYPALWVWLLPLTAAILGWALALLFLPKSETTVR